MKKLFAILAIVLLASVYSWATDGTSQTGTVTNTATVINALSWNLPSGGSIGSVGPGDSYDPNYVTQGTLNGTAHNIKVKVDWQNSAIAGTGTVNITANGSFDDGPVVLTDDTWSATIAFDGSSTVTVDYTSLSATVDATPGTYNFTIDYSAMYVY